jgi:hypothetical protein
MITGFFLKHPNPFLCYGQYSPIRIGLDALHDIIEEALSLLRLQGWPLFDKDG